MFNGKIVGVVLDYFVIEVIGDFDKIELLFGFLKRFGVMEVMCIGTIVMERWIGYFHDSKAVAKNNCKNWGEVVSV